MNRMKNQSKFIIEWFTQVITKIESNFDYTRGITPKRVANGGSITSTMAWWLRAFALEAGRLGSILSRVKPKTLKLVSAVILAKRSAIKCSSEDKIIRE